MASHPHTAATQDQPFTPPKGHRNSNTNSNSNSTNGNNSNSNNTPNTDSAFNFPESSGNVGITLNSSIGNFTQANSSLAHGSASNTDSDDPQQQGNNPANTNWNLIKNPSNGRTRISQACDRCRARKIKCSGKSENNPKCTNCDKDGFPCVVSDKLTRNSFPKGYTKNLEKKLLDVELDRNQLLMEISKLRQKLAIHDPSFINSELHRTSSTLRSGRPTSSIIARHNVKLEDMMDVDMLKSEDDIEMNYDDDDGENDADREADGEVEVEDHDDDTSSQTHQNQSKSQDAISKQNIQSPQELDNNNIKISRHQVYFKKPINTNASGLLTLDQNLKSPFETIFTLLKANPFKGYKTAGFNPNSAASNVSDNKSTTSSNSNTTNNQNFALPIENLSPSAFKYLTNYHMNLNRYLNLVLYKLIFPLFNSESKNGSPANKNLDHLIWTFFNDYNKLIPILDFELFYNDYLTFVNTYTVKNSTYVDNGETKKRYFEFTPKDQDTLIKLILILKYTLSQPKINENNSSSAFLPDKFSLNQFDESVKLINVKHLIMMFRNINFSLSPNLDKLEISLLMLYYLIKYENYNLPNYTDSLHSHKDFLLDVININKSLVHTLHIDKSNHLIISNIVTNKKLIELQRLKLYWNFKILIKLSEIYFNIPLIEKEYDLSQDIDDDDENSKLLPATLDSIVLVNKDINITLCLVKLLKLIPWNIMDYVNNNNLNVLKKVDTELSNWKKSVEDLYNEENCVVFNKLKSYYLYFKVLVNINGTIDSSYFIDFVNLVHDLTFSNPKSNVKQHEISLEAAESLCLHSFNFHLLTLISITSLQNNKDKALCEKTYKLIQLYQILINYKDVDPLITTFVNYIRDNIPQAFSDSTNTCDDSLKMFTSTEMDKSNNSSLFDRKIHRGSVGNAKSQMNFDLNAFNLPGDTSFFNEDNSSCKRRKSSASSASFISSNVSLGSRESSIVSSSRRFSASSNDSTPSLFPSATSPYHNSSSGLATSSNPQLPTSSNDITSSAKKRIMDYAIQPIRTMNRSRSMSADSKIRSAKIADRRLSGSGNNFNNFGFAVTRDNSIDSTNQIQNKQYTTDDNHMEEDLISHILNSDVDSEVDSELGNITSFRPTNKVSNFKHNSSLLPTIPSEGNLMKIMGVLDTKTALDAKKLTSGASEFDLESLFSVNNISTGQSGKLFDDHDVAGNAGLGFDGLSDDLSDFSKAYKKSPSVNGGGSRKMSEEKSLIDNDDLNRLREHVRGMKSSIQ